MRLLLLAGIFFASFTAFSQDLKAYQIFDSKGKKTTFDAMVKASIANQVVLFGELHDDPIAHWLQVELAKAIYAKNDHLSIGAEMFELHQKEALNTYLSNGDMKMLKDSSKLWSNFDTDYAPLLEWSQQNKIPYFATNVTRKYASLIFKKGVASLDSLPVSEKNFMCPLPFPFDSTLSQYQELIEMGKEMHASGINFALAQAIKDATMGYVISQNLQEKGIFLHLNGAFHSDYHQGIMWYVEQYKKGTKVLTISTIGQDSLDKLENENKDKADFIIVTPSTMTRTMN